MVRQLRERAAQPRVPSLQTKAPGDSGSWVRFQYHNTATQACYTQVQERVAVDGQLQSWRPGQHEAGERFVSVHLPQPASGLPQPGAAQAHPRAAVHCRQTPQSSAA